MYYFFVFANISPNNRIGEPQYICIFLKNGIRIYLYSYSLKNVNPNIYSYLYLPKKCDSNIFIFLFEPENCIRHTLQLIQLHNWDNFTVYMTTQLKSTTFTPILPLAAFQFHSLKIIMRSQESCLLIQLQDDTLKLMRQQNSCLI